MVEDRVIRLVLVAAMNTWHVAGGELQRRSDEYYFLVLAK